MNAQDLAALIAGGETLAVEFKSERTGSFSDRELIETVACMANRDDDGEGWVLLGVEGDGEITGACPRTRPQGRTCCVCRHWWATARALPLP